MFCPANSQQCSFCGKFGHFRRCCRLAQNEWRSRPHGETDRHCGVNSHVKNSDLDARQYIVIQIKDRTLQCLIDTGSVRSVISRNLVKQLRLNVLPLDSPCTLVAASGQNLRTIGRVEVNMQIKGLTMPSTFVVVEGLCPNLLLGTDFFEQKSCLY